MRICHEASLYDDNCFITLTYNAENCPPDGGLIKSDFQKFMKRLRKKYSDRKIRFYQCGEYGDRNNRPHYHAILFNYNFDDWTYLHTTANGSDIYTSPTLSKIWGLGFVTIGSVNFESAGYVARYCMKKLNGQKVDEIDEKTGLKPYERINDFTGEIHEVLPEYATMSRGGRHGRGIGYDWISEYTNDVYPKDFTTIRGVKMRPPKYYDKCLEEIDPYLYDTIKNGRQEQQFLMQADNTEQRLSVRETIKAAQFNQLKRSL